jgi:energy-coupling factor transporter ATP-binding protein EcfA2
MSQSLLTRGQSLNGQIIDHDLPTRCIDENIFVVNRDGSVGVGLKFELPNLLCMGSEIREQILTQLRLAMITLPEHIDVQFVHLQHHRADLFDDAFLPGSTENAVISSARKEKRDFINQSFKSKRLRHTTGYFILVRRNTVKLSTIRDRTVAQERAKLEYKGFSGSLRWRMKWLKLQVSSAQLDFRVTEEEYRKGLDDLTNCTESFADSLRAISQFGKIEVMNDDAIIRLFFAYWNPQSYDMGRKPAKYRPHENRPLTDYFVQSPFCWDPLGKEVPAGMCLMDDVYHRILTVHLPPELMFLTSFDQIVYDSGVTRIAVVVNIQRGDATKRKRVLLDKLPLLQQLASKDPSQRPAYEQLVNELEQLGRDADRVWHATHIIRIWGTTPDEVIRDTQAIKKAAEAAGGMGVTEERAAFWEYFRASQPFWTRDKDSWRQHTYNTSQIVTQLPLPGCPSNLERPIACVFESAGSGVFNLNLQDQGMMTNYNAIIVGGSGSGKSFIMCSYLADVAPLEPKPRVFVVDYGGSFRGLAEVMGGTYLPFDVKDASRRINPLQISDQKTLNPDEILNVLFILKKILFGPDDAQEERNLIPKIEEKLRSAYYNAHERNKILTLSEFHGYLKEDPELKIIARRLSQYIGSGTFSRLFDGETAVSLNSPLTVFDLKGVKAHAALRPVMFGMLIQQVMLAASKWKGPKYLIFDEAWDMLADPDVAAYVEAAFRTLRKEGFSVIAISQGVEEIRNMKNQGAILTNISTRILLKQNDPGEIEALAKVLDLDDREQEMLKSLQSVPGKFSEALVISDTQMGRKSTAVVNRTVPTMYAAFTTNPGDRQMIEHIMASGKSYFEALIEFARRYPNGVMHA